MHGEVVEANRETKPRHPVAGKPRIDRALELAEGARRRRRSFVEQPEAAAQHRCARCVQQQGASHAGRPVAPRYSVDPFSARAVKLTFPSLTAT